MNDFIRPTLSVGLLVLMAEVYAGCAAVGVAGDVAGSAVETTQELAHAGKVDNMSVVTIDQATTAVYQAAGRMELHYLQKMVHPDQLKLIFTDLRKQKVTVTLIRRTEVVTAIHVDVGFFGEEDMGRLLIREISAALPRASTDLIRSPLNSHASEGSRPTTQQ